MRSIPANQSRAVLFAIDAHMFFFVFFARPCQRATDGRYLVLFFLVYLVFVVAGLGWLEPRPSFIRHGSLISQPLKALCKSSRCKWSLCKWAVCKRVGPFPVASSIGFFSASTVFFSIIFFSFFFFLFRKAASTKEKKKILKKKSFQNEIQLNGLDSGRDLERSSGLGTKISNNKKKTEKPIKRIPSRPVSDWNSREKAENSLPVSVVFFCSTEWTLLQKNPVKSVKTR